MSVLKKFLSDNWLLTTHKPSGQQFAFSCSSRFDDQLYGFIVGDGDGLGIGFGSAGTGVPNGVGSVPGVGVGVGVGVGSEGFFGDGDPFGVGVAVGVGVAIETASELLAANVPTGTEANVPKNTNVAAITTMAAA